MAVKLRAAGIDSFRIYEKADAVGGTWRDNTYPGLVCDIPSHYYSFSFEPNPDWSRFMAPGGEIKRYLEHVADKYDIRRHITFGTEIASAEYEDARWRVRTTAGEEMEADFFIAASGVLHHPHIPDLPGLETFAGAQFHSARWDHDVPLEGSRVGVVGSGSTGIQIVTALAGVAGHLTLFQRTAQWIYPTPNVRYRRLSRSLKRRFSLFNRLSYGGLQRYVEFNLGRAVVQPGPQRKVLSAICRAHLYRVRDPELRRKLRPDHEPMCKRLIVSGGFYSAIQRPDTSLVTEAIQRIEPAGVVTADGTLHELDVLVLATGFRAHEYMRPMELVGKDGLTLEELWRDRAFAYRTVALPGFPNFFVVIGPHSPFGNQSNMIIAETITDYIVRCIRMWVDGEVDAMSPTFEATERLNEDMRAAMPDTIWLSGCKSWYLGPDGLPEMWPWIPSKHRDMLRDVKLDEFDLKLPA